VITEIFAVHVHSRARASGTDNWLHVGPSEADSASSIDRTVVRTEMAKGYYCREAFVIMLAVLDRAHLHWRVYCGLAYYRHRVQ
jgi:hypothetical protein